MITQNYPYTDYHNLNLDWVISKIKEFEVRFNNIESDILEQANRYADEQIEQASMHFNEQLEHTVETLMSDYNNFINEVNGKIAGLDNSYDKFVKEVSDRIVLINARIDKMQDVVNSVLAQANSYTQQSIINNNEYIIKQTTNALSTVTVLNYFTGNRISIQEMFDYLSKFHLQNAINYGQMNTRALTYTQFNALNMTYTNLALDGGTLYV